MKIAAFGATNYASTEIRINFWVRAMNALGHKATFYKGGMNEPDKLDERVKNCDIVITGRTHDPRQIAMLHAGRDIYKYKLVVDTDDLITDIPAYNMASQLFHNATGMVRISLGEYAAADTMTVSTEFLRKETLRHNPNTVLIPNYVDSESMGGIRWRDKEDRHKDDIRLYWGGGGGHYDDLLLVSKPILALFHEYPKLKLIFGNFVPHWAAMLPINRVFLHKVVPYYDYPKLVAWLCADIGIAPLVDNPFNRAKSHVKYLDYYIAHVPGVYQNIDAYTEMDSVRHGATGLLASSENNWYNNLKQLIDDKEARLSIAEAASEDLVVRWDIRNHAYKYERMLLDTLTRPILNNDGVRVRESAPTSESLSAG